MIEAKSASSSANEVDPEHSCLRMLRADLARGLDPAPVGESDVHHDEASGLRAVGLIDRLSNRRGLCSHVDVVLGRKHRSDPVAHDLVVVDEHDPERRERFGSVIEGC